MISLSMRKTVSELAVALVSASALMLGAGATSAHAATANASIYAIAPQWGGWCTGPLNKVTSVRWANNTVGKTGGDSGDDIVYMPVRKGVNNSVVIGVTCRYATPTGMLYTIKPSRHGQSYWFKLNGSYTKN